MVKRSARHDGGLRRHQQGLGFLVLLFALATLSIALAGTGVLWEMESRREKEKELLFIGEEYRHALGSYYENTPGETKLYPQKLDDLLDDQRAPLPARHLRRLYRDPMSPDGQWELIRDQGRIMGVASKSQGIPIKIAGFTAAQKVFEGAGSYTAWRFLSSGADAAPKAAPAAGASPATPATPAAPVTPLTPIPLPAASTATSATTETASANATP